MRKLRIILIIIIMVSVIPIIEIEKVDELNGTTVLDYRNLVSYGWEYTVQWYLNYKENLPNEERSSKIGHESKNSQIRPDDIQGMGQRTIKEIPHEDR